MHPGAQLTWLDLVGISTFVGVVVGGLAFLITLAILWYLR